MLRSMKRLVARGTVLLGLWCSQGTVAWGAVQEEELPKGAVTVEATPAESSAKHNSSNPNSPISSNFGFGST